LRVWAPGASTPTRRLSLGTSQSTDSIEEVLSAVGALHPAIEVPNSRYREFAKVGAPQLIADTACACWFLIGAEAATSWRDTDLSQHRVIGYRNGRVAAEGIGANVLGDPRVALT